MNNIDLDSNIPITITIKISDDTEIQKLNKHYFNRDYPTDVLSFNFNEKQGNNFHLGDIIVSLDTARKQCNEYKNDIEHEIAELVEHGVLHLLGVHHEDDDEKSVHGIEVSPKNFRTDLAHELEETPEDAS